MYVCMYVCSYVFLYMTSVPIDQTNRYIFSLLNTDDINYANVYVRMYVCMCLAVYRAANAGFVYSHVMVNSQPYNIGLVSALPFEVVEEGGPIQGFQRVRVRYF